MRGIVMNIEKIYRVIIDYDVSDKNGEDCCDKVENKAYQYTKKYNVDLNTYGGGAAHGPYIILECECEKKVAKVAEMIVRYIKRFNDHTVQY